MKIYKLNLFLFLTLVQATNFIYSAEVIKNVAKANSKFRIIPTLIFVLPAIKILSGIFNTASTQTKDLQDLKNEVNILNRKFNTLSNTVDRVSSRVSSVAHELYVSVPDSVRQ